MRPDAVINYPDFSRAEIVSTMLGLMLGLFLAGLDQTIVATALPYIARDLNAWQSMGWIVTAYLVSSTAATPIYGRLSDLYGRRPVVLVSVAIFIGASLLCALSRTFPELIAARVLQGVGGGGLRSMALVVIADLVPPRERGRYQGYFAGVMTTANALGPILGGFLAQELSWSWIFWINLPIGLVACALSSRHLVRLKAPSQRFAIDWIGAVLTVVAVTVMLIGIDELKKSADWSSPFMIVLLGSGMACTAALIWRERLAPQPMLPLHLFNNPIFVAGIAVTSLMSAMLVGLIVVIPLNYQLVLGLSPSSTGLRMIPLTSGTAVGSLIAGQLVSRSGHYRLFVSIGAATAGLACVAIAETGLGFSPLFDVTMTGLLGLACGFQISPISVAVQNALHQEDTGVGMASLLLFRSLAGAIGVALFSALLVGAIGLDAFAGPLHEALGHSTVSHLSDPSSPLSAGSLTVLGDAFRFAFSRIFFGGTIIMAIAFCVALSLREIPLQKGTYDYPRDHGRQPSAGSETI